VRQQLVPVRLDKLAEGIPVWLASGAQPPGLAGADACRPSHAPHATSSANR